MGVAGALKDLYAKTLGGEAPAGSALSTGDISQMIKYLIANPSNPSINNALLGTAVGTHGFNHAVSGIFLFGLNHSGDPHNNLQTSSDPSPTNCAIVYDTTNNRTYLRNVTGGTSNLSFTGQFPFHPRGPWSHRDQFDSESGGHGQAQLYGSVDTFVTEVECTWTAACASDNETICGFISNGFNSGLTAGAKGIGFYRKNGAAGWTIISADGTTRSETSEASDTSDGNKHIFRIEWQDKATPEARLYVDGVLKVTKTTNLPAISSATNMPNQLGFGTDTALANDTLRWYAANAYWKQVA